jgi:hypothetical protein
MDVEINVPHKTNGPPKDAIVIACASAGYFIPFFKNTQSFPLVTTTNLLAPEAYVIKHVIEAWASFKSVEEIRYSAAEAYNKYQKCGINGASRLFKTGW